jgi:hypothetical protein
MVHACQDTDSFPYFVRQDLNEVFGEKAIGQGGPIP